MTPRRLLAILLLLGSSLSQARAADSVFDLAALLAPPLNAKTIKGPYEKEGVLVEEVVFHSETDGDKSVDIFAILAYPRGAKNLPAFVWNQGGLGKASDYFPILGAKRGYAALCIDFPLPGYRSSGGYNIVSGLATADDARRAPIYHGAVALLRAVSFLESRPEVDKDKIGMCGSSWGGFYTTLMVGVDPRLKAGAAMFGCGFLDTGNNWWGPPGAPRFPTPEYVSHWMETLDPGPRLAHTKTPIAWFSGTNDMFYWMPAMMKSYDAAAGPKLLALFPNWAHGLPSEGDEEVFTFLDVHLRGRPALLKVSPITFREMASKNDPRRHVEARWNFSGPRQAKSAVLILSYGDEGNWLSRHWKTLPATIDRDHECGVELPDSPIPYYVGGAVVDADGFWSSTPLVRVDVAALGLLNSNIKIDDDGCDMWGGFEPGQVDWSVRLGFMNPKVSPDAKTGKQSARFDAGKHRLFPIYFTAGLPHRLSFFAKAEKPTEVTLRFAGTGVVDHAEHRFTVGADWTAITLDITTPDAANATLDAVLTVPAGASLLVDDVSFRPR